AKGPPKTIDLNRFIFNSSGTASNNGSSGVQPARQQFQASRKSDAPKISNGWMSGSAQHKLATKATTAPVSGQRTITSMFSTKSKLLAKPVNQQQQQQRQQNPARAPSMSKPAANPLGNGDIIDLDDLDLDLDALYGDGLDSDLDEAPAQQHNPPPHSTTAATTTSRALPFALKSADQALPLSRISGDNSLVEETHRMDLKAMETYIYPLLDGQPARAYQQGAIRRCLFQNTLVALPTGMGKTLIAVVVMANFARWFPDSMTVFLAPTKPLVTQQMHACNGMIHAILKRTGVPASAIESLQDQSNWVVQMNGSVSAESRSALWKGARFVFATPQILQNDLKSGTLDGDTARRISLVVIDEAHRATGKYAYGESISLLREVYFGNQIQAVPLAAPFRVMALTATPGSKINAVQEVIHRLFISHIFLRTEESMDVAPYLHGRRIEEMVIPMPPWLLAARECLGNVMKRSINILCHVCGAMQNPGDPLRVASFAIRTERDRFMQRPYGGGASGMDKGRILSEFTVAMMLASAIQLLSEHGLRPAWASLRECNLEVMRARQKIGQTSRAKADCVDSVEWATMMREFGQLVDALDNRPAGTSNRSLGAKPAQSNGQQRTDVVSNFFSVSNTAPGGSGRPGQSIASLTKPGFLGHPKLERLLQVVRDHFSKTQATGSLTASTRIIVFSQYRGSVNEIVGVLSRLKPQVSCEPFIGQSRSSTSSAPASGSRGRGRGGGGWGWRGRGRGGSSGGGFSRGAAADSEDTDPDHDIPSELLGEQGSRGQTQKEQLAVLDRFRKGQTNVIVATCVGEEGLDIGEVDLIINYDAPGSPVRLLQRIGRTGRARRGTVILFLAKDTREENTYKKAQREYKSVQQKISTGKGLMLRAEISPPMVPPGLPTGPPACKEIDVSKEDIALAASEMDHGSKSKTRRAKPTVSSKAKRKRQGIGAGVDLDEMAEFVWLTNKYHVDLAHGHGGSGGFISAASVSSGARQAITPGSEKGTVSNILDRGAAWQAQASPSCSVAHTQRSEVYWRVMAGIEHARFSHDLGDQDDQSQPGSSQSRFKMPGSTLTVQDAGRPFVNEPLKAIQRETKRVAAHRPALKPKPKPKKPKLALNKSDMSDFESAISLISDDDDNGTKGDSDEELEDIDSILSKAAAAPRESRSADMLRPPPLPPQTARRASPEPGPSKNAANNVMVIDSSPLENDFLHKLADQKSPSPPLRRSAEVTPARPAAKKPASVRSSVRRKAAIPASGPAASAKRRRESSAGTEAQTSQRNLSETLDKLAKSGKAKRAFDWSMSFHAKLVGDAKTAGVDLALNDPAGLDDPQLLVCHDLPLESPFGNIGMPGAFDKLYDENQPHSTPEDPMAQSEDQSRQLCAASDSGSGSGLSASDHTSHTDSSPPTQPIPESPPALSAQRSVDEFDTALMDMSINPSTLDNLMQSAQLMVPATPNEEPVLLVAESGHGLADLKRNSALGTDILDGIDMGVLDIDMDAAEILAVSSDDDYGSAEDRHRANAAASIQAVKPAPPSSPQSMPRRSPRPQVHRQSPSPSPMAEAAAGLSQHVAMPASSSPVRGPGRRRLIRGRAAAHREDSPECNRPFLPPLSTAAQGDTVTPVQTRREKRHERGRLKRPPQAPKKLAWNQFIDNEVEVGDSESGDDGPRRKVVISEDEEDSRENLDQDLSSFIVDDEDVEYDTPRKSRSGLSAARSAADDLSPDHSNGMDFYRRTMHSQGTPVSELMRQLAEREKKRRWVDDTPVRKNTRPLMLVRGDDDSDTHSVAGYTDDEDEDEDGQGSSDFERAEDLFTQHR
ncbi:3'-5' DNA helicase, partial [Linderina pennispora]